MSIKYNDTSLTAITYNGVTLYTIVYDGTTYCLSCSYSSSSCGTAPCSASSATSVCRVCSSAASACNAQCTTMTTRCTTSQGAGVMSVMTLMTLMNDDLDERRSLGEFTIEERRARWLERMMSEEKEWKATCDTYLDSPDIPQENKDEFVRIYNEIHESLKEDIGVLETQLKEAYLDMTSYEIVTGEQKVYVYRN